MVIIQTVGDYLVHEGSEHLWTPYFLKGSGDLHNYPCFHLVIHKRTQKEAIGRLNSVYWGY